VAPTLIGYFPKRLTEPPDWLKVLPIEEICSVSGCISQEPEDWIDQWQHNECWVFDTPELAWSVVPLPDRSAFRLYAFKMYPARFEHGQLIQIELPTLQVSPLPPSFNRLGYDIVSRSVTPMFECSPLSCNNMAEHHPVNRCCLVETEADGLRIAIEFSISEPEPGPYYLVEVWR
jgi:hypothetical protein